MTEATMTRPTTRDATDAQFEPTLRADRHGYVLGKESVEGFADRPELAMAGRLKLARWARRFSSADLSDVQEGLLGDADGQGDKIDRELLHAALLDAEQDV